MLLVVELDGAVIGDLMVKVGDAWAQAEVKEQARGVQAELGWVLHPDHTGHGYATEAVRELLRLCFDELGLQAGHGRLLRRQRGVVAPHGAGRDAARDPHPAGVAAPVRASGSTAWATPCWPTSGATGTDDVGGPLRTLGHVGVELGEPGARAGVGRHPPVAARRQRAAGDDLRTVGERRALELVGEEALDEDLHPAPDRREVVCRPLGLAGSPRATPAPRCRATRATARKAILLGR